MDRSTRATERAALRLAVAGLAVVLSAQVQVVLATEGTTYQVTSAADAGAGSLRAAILAANANAGADVIAFSGPFNIAPTSTLPAIQEGPNIISSSQAVQQVHSLTIGLR